MLVHGDDVDAGTMDVPESQAFACILEHGVVDGKEERQESR